MRTIKSLLRLSSKLVIPLLILLISTVGIVGADTAIYGVSNSGPNIALPNPNININNVPIVQWSKTYGISNNCFGDCSTIGQQTKDGGYILINEPFIKTDSIGNIQWSKDFGHIVSGQQTKDGGYILGSDIITKTDSKGNVQWSKVCSTPGSSVYYIQQTSDNGYIIGIATQGTQSQYAIDYTTIKTDSKGNIKWKQLWAGNRYDIIASLIQTSDGGIVLIESKESGKSTSMKYNKNGKQIWTNKPIVDSTKNIHGQAINGGGFIVIGFDYDTGNWIGKFDKNGNELWKRPLDKGSDSYAYVSQTPDGYIIGGGQNINNGIVGLIIKTDKNGNELWSMTTGIQNSYINSIQQTSDGGYIAIGDMNHKMWLEKLQNRRNGRYGY